MSNTAIRSTNVVQGFLNPVLEGWVTKWSCLAFCPMGQKMFSSKDGGACLPPGCLQVDTKTIYSTLTWVCTPDRAALGVSTQSTSHGLNPPPPPGYTVSAIINTDPPSVCFFHHPSQSYYRLRHEAQMSNLSNRALHQPRCSYSLEKYTSEHHNEANLMFKNHRGMCNCQKMSWGALGRSNRGV